MNPDHSNPEPDTPLAHTHLTVTITDLLAEYELRHAFHNSGVRLLEAVYSFPVPLDAAFIGMEATLADETLHASVMPAKRATTHYDDAIGEGDSAVLLERLEPGTLCVSLGNLKPGEDGEVVLRFVASLSVADRIARFSLPVVQRPRYGRSRLDDLFVPRHDFAVEHPLEADIRVRGLLADRPVQCTTHGAQFQRAADGTTLHVGHAMLDRDLVLCFELGDAPLAAARVIDDGDRSLGLLSFTVPPPTSAAEKAPLDLCLLLDGSGSMSGDAIAQSRAALQALADALQGADRIQVLRFGSNVVPLFRRPLRASARVRAALAELAPTVQADLGGTEMGAALQRALRDLAQVPGDARRRVIILVTDGAVNAADIAAARDDAVSQGVQIFVVAVGSSAGVDVLAPLAEATRGRVERAVPAEPIEDGVLRQLRRARNGHPVAVDIRWPDALHAPPTGLAFPGDAVTTVAVLPKASSAAAQQTATICFGASQRLELALRAPAVDAAARAWAGQQIYFAAAEPEREPVALRYGLITEETSAVLVKVRAAQDKAGGLPQTVAVRHMVPEGMVTTGTLGLEFSLSEALLSRSMSVGKDIGAFDVDMDAFDAPTFLRQKRSAPNDLHFRDADAEAAAEPAEKALAPERVAAVRVALSYVLSRLLLDEEVEEIDLARVLGALDEGLRDDARRYLAQLGNPVADVQDAIRLLTTLLEDDGAPELTDEQEARLALLQPSTAPAWSR